MGLTRSLLLAVTGLLALFATYYQAILKPKLETLGYFGREVEAINNGKCTTVPDLAACESELKQCLGTSSSP